MRYRKHEKKQKNKKKKFIKRESSKKIQNMAAIDSWKDFIYIERVLSLWLKKEK